MWFISFLRNLFPTRLQNLIYGADDIITALVYGIANSRGKIRCDPVPATVSNSGIRHAFASESVSGSMADIACQIFIRRWVRRGKFPFRGSGVGWEGMGVGQTPVNELEFRSMAPWARLV